jgi:hypothetical protein
MWKVINVHILIVEKAAPHYYKERFSEELKRLHLSHWVKWPTVVSIVTVYHFF